MRILFSCMGTSDPVRGYRDGPMLHILRHYRPDIAVVFLSGEAAALNDCDARVETVIDFIKGHWNDYSPELRIIRTNIADPSDMDEVSGPISDAVAKLADAHPNDEILLNLSSGTPQMNIVLSFLASDSRLNTIGVQVKNPEKASGRTERTNAENYSVTDELECNEDESTKAPNRCIEPKLMHFQRQKVKDQIIALLDERNYSAIYSMKNSMPDSIKALVGHMDARDRLQGELARKRAQNLQLPFSLYPANVSSRKSDYAEISEAYLVLMNRCHRQQYEELILRLNPLIVRLELRLMKNVLSDMNLCLEDVISCPYSLRPHFIPSMLEQSLPRVYSAVCSSFGGALRESDVSIDLCYRILKNLPNVPEEALSLIGVCSRLNDSCRNELAHQLTAVTADQIKAACSMYPAQLLKQVGELIASMYPECDPELFTIYKRCGDYIKDNLI